MAEGLFFALLIGAVWDFIWNGILRPGIEFREQIRKFRDDAP